MHSRSTGWLPVSCSGSSSSMQAWTSCGQGQWAWLVDTCRAAEDWLLEEEVLLSEMVECGLLKGVGWLRAGTAVEAWALDSGRRQKASRRPLLQKCSLDARARRGPQEDWPGSLPAAAALLSAALALWGLGSSWQGRVWEGWGRLTCSIHVVLGSLIT